MSAYSRRAILAVRADAAAAANSAAAQVDTDGAGHLTFRVGLVPPGSPPGAAPTWYWCSWALTPAQWTAITTRLAALPDAGTVVRVYDGAVWTPEAVLADLGLERARSVMP